MISRRDKLLNYPWEQQRYEHHKQKLRSAKPAIDVRTPLTYSHVTLKPKKVQTELERLRQIEAENIRLLQKLGNIMRSTRLQNFWLQPRPNFLNREKLFETRPHSSLPKLIAIYAPTNDLASQSSFSATSISTRTARRCPTCSGRPERTEVRIPEQRIPWAPLKKSLNTKTKDVNVPKRCLHCGHPKNHNISNI